MSRIQFAPGARTELQEAHAFYAAISSALGRRFALAIGDATESVARAPAMWPPVTRGLRRYVVKTFPYVLLYRAEGDAVLIVAVAHQSRRPGYWRTRV